ncbi:hypothetical protein BgAZ_304640 [Babesia gibsoni]|uniref:Uncharacterized protein n=1 Tax=Babesia gibsoni TaxID=33632 RepID=A0AAD8LQD1_BABGI|nr:hypothetical protein BgAZ_304640 [Babesia gibsoni]
MPDNEETDERAEVVELTEGWSLCNDDLYRIANQLLSLVFANKYFGDDSNNKKLLRVCEAFHNEFSALEDKVEKRPNFDYDKVYEMLLKVINGDQQIEDNEDVLVEEDKSTLFGICPISRRPITHPVSQR